MAERGEGATILEGAGKGSLDFTAGIAVNATGRDHPEVVKAIAEQTGRLIHLSGSDFQQAPRSSRGIMTRRFLPGVVLGLGLMVGR